LLAEHSSGNRKKEEFMLHSTLEGREGLKVGLLKEEAFG